MGKFSPGFLEVPTLLYIRFSSGSTWLPIILKRLAELPKVQVNFGHEMQHLEQIDTDGPSLQSTLVGINMYRSTWKISILSLLTFEYDLTSLRWAPGNEVVGDGIWSIAATLGKGNLWRVAYGIPTTGPDPDVPFDEERELIGMISFYPLRQLCADTSAQGRIALAGDSAHLTSPVGGLGLTTGLLDAAVLARTLKQIILEAAPLTLLESYGGSWRDVFQNVASPSAIFHTRLLTGTDAKDTATREEFLGKVSKLDFGYLKKIGETYEKITSARDD
ncbi:hypothetical protein BDV10DRAFT_186938 [Aspergillus recurvatus]